MLRRGNDAERAMLGRRVINRMGSIAGGSTVSDYHKTTARQISVRDADASRMAGKEIQHLDCPDTPIH